MRYLIFAVLIAVGSFTTASYAAPKMVRTYESCSQLADQRGFMPNEKYGGRKRFVNRCMKGKID